MNSVTRPIVRYHGGKWKLAPWILSHFPPHRVYVEPFGGGGSVLLRKPRSYAEIYNDLDGEIVNLFRVARDQGDDLVRACELTPFSRADYLESFIPSDDPVEQARRTVVRAFMGFGSNALCHSIKSGFRAKSERSGTTAAHDWRNYPEALAITIDRLQGVVIENRDAADIVRRHDSQTTLHYCDPPYVHETRMIGRGVTRKGYTHEMTDDDHAELAAVLAGVEGMVIVSGYPCGLYEELYSDWHRVERQAHADGARPRTEVLWMSDRCRAALEETHHDLFSHG